MPRMTFFDYVSSVGGVLGLFMGFSIISLVEIFYWLAVGVGEYVQKERQLRKKTGAQVGVGDGLILLREARNPN